MLKKEIRILGLSNPTKMGKEVAVVGVVFRGSLWLDGAFISVVKSQPERDLARAIRSCKQYSQLHAVILSKDRPALGKRIDIRELSHRIKLPIIAIHGSRRSKIRNGFQIQAGGRSTLVSLIGITPQRTEEIFAVTCARKSWTPEALRVAEMIATKLDT